MQSTARKLGRLPAKRDRRNLKLATYLKTYPAPPAAQDWGRILGDRRVTFMNDTIGDCAVAAPGHAIRAFTANHGTEVTPSDADILAAYRAVSGYDPGNPLTDTGAVMIDALNFWRKIGIAGHKIEAFVAIDPRNRLEVEAAINLFGGVFFGLDMPLASQDQTVWDVAPPGKYDDARYTPGSWGGHAVFAPTYSRVGVVCITWGELKPLTWEFEMTYAEEAYAALGPDWASGSVVAPNGFDVDQLRADLAAITR